MKIALGMIIRNLDSEQELMGFIDNAEKYGHKIDGVIVAYTHTHDPVVEYNIRKKVPFYAININNPYYCKEQMRHRGISDSLAKVLLECPVDTKAGLVPYGFNRMIVVTEAILRGMDTLFFVDSDVYSKVLKREPDGSIIEKDVDFFGAHLEHLNSGSDVTTGEYSGYNILPPASFDGMDAFLAGVQKSDMHEYWQTSMSHRCLVVQPDNIESKPCKKILGGNMAIKLSAFANLPPFFSSYYTLDGELFLCRGEDTVLGMEIAKGGIKCTDIGINPLHDTYKEYPNEPDLKNDPSVKERFYYACTGWVGRNPFFNHILGNDLKETREYQREHLERGLKALSDYTAYPRFNTVIKNFDASWDNVKKYVSEFEHVSESWHKFMEGWNK
ncbi:MAG: hypothetical protein FWD38_02070 [Oscillospiraceae bacterium]|nr:hypothetical protein [Oscillospiraceae bacterium]